MPSQIVSFISVNELIGIIKFFGGLVGLMVAGIGFIFETKLFYVLDHNVRWRNHIADLSSFGYYNKTQCFDYTVSS